MRIKLLAILLLPLAAIAAIRIDSGASIQPIAIGDEIRLTVPGIQAETSAWQSAVTANGGTYNATDTRAVDYFISQCKAKGIWSLIDWTALFAGRNLNAALVPVKHSVGSSVITNNNFVEGDFSPTVGLTGNGTTKYLNPGFNNNSFGNQNSKTLGVAVTSVPTGTMHMFSAGSNNGTGLFRTSGNFGARLNCTSAIGLGGVVRGPVLVSRTTSADVIYISGLGNGSVASASEPPSVDPMYLFANSTPAAFSTGALGAGACGQGMTAQQLSDLAAILTQAMTILGRPTP